MLAALWLLLLGERKARGFSPAPPQPPQPSAREGGISRCSRVRVRRPRRGGGGSEEVPPPLRFRSTASTSTARPAYYPYGRGAEIWPPPVDGDKPLDVADSFPHRNVPPEVAARMILEATGGVTSNSSSSKSKSVEEEPNPATWTRTSLMNSLTRRILRRAAARDEIVAVGGGDDPSSPPLQSTVRRFVGHVPKLPGFLAIGLVASRIIPATDVLGVTVVSLYLVALGVASHVLRDDGVTPSCPGLPPQGHVPLLVRVPLGPTTVKSRPFVAWCRMAALLGLFQPLVAAALYHPLTVSTTASGATAAAAAAAARLLLLRPVFWACCQLITERAGRRTFPATPLPIRILIPVLYNSIRIPMLWECATSSYWGPLGRIFAVLNLAFWSVNLFGFLLPVAAMRYLRAHFFLVEAEQVTLRPGMEGTIGLPL